MKARWIFNVPSPQLPLVAVTIVAHWLPWKFYRVSTVQVWADKSDAMYQLMERSFGTPQTTFATQVSKCDRTGWSKDMEHFYYEKEFSNLSEAEYGHREIVELLSKGKLKLKKTSSTEEFDG